MPKRTKIRDSARDQDCQVRIPGVCSFNPDETVLAHLNGAGMGTKHHDIHAAYACNSCHMALDGRSKTPYSAEQLKLMHLEGVIRTQLILLSTGLLEAK